MNILLKILGCLLLLVMNFHSFSQSRLNVKAADTLDFLLVVNEVKANNIPCLSITIDKLQPGKHAIKITVPSHPDIVVEQILTLKKNTSVFYELEKSKGVYKLILKSESIVQLESISETTSSNIMPASNVPATQHVNDLVSITNTDPGTVDRMTLEITDKDGCLNLVDPAIYDQMLEEVSSNFFEVKKLDVMKNFLSQHCVRVEQLRHMMSRLSLEENKLELLRASEDHIYDTKNLKLVEEDFFLEKNRARANQMNTNSRP